MTKNTVLKKLKRGVNKAKVKRITQQKREMQRGIDIVAKEAKLEDRIEMETKLENDKKRMVVCLFDMGIILLTQMEKI